MFDSDIRNSFIQYGQVLKTIKPLNMSIIEDMQALGTAVSNLAPKQQALALATKGLTTTEIQQVLISNKISKEEAAQAVIEAGLTQKKKELSIAVAQEALVSAGLEETKALSIMQSAGIVASDGTETVSKKKVSVATLETKLANEGLSASQIKLITTQMGLSTSTVALSNYFKGLAASTWASVKAIGAFLVTNPVGWCVLAAGAVAGVVAIVDSLTTSFEEQKEITEKLQDEYNDLTDQISKVESELKSVTDRVDELNSKEHLTFVEQEELENLEKTTFQLERQNELLKEQQELKAKELSKSIKKEYEKDFQSKDILDGTYATKEEKIQVKLDYYKKYKDNEDYLREWSDEIEETRQYLVDSALDIQDYISRYGVDDETSQSWQDLFESIDRVLDPTAYKTKDFNDILNYKEFKKDVEEINDLLASGEFNKDVLNKQFPELLEAMHEVGFTTEEVVEQFYSMNNIVDEQGAILDDTSSNIEDFSKVLEIASTKQSVLKSAMEDMADTGYLSSDTYATLIELGGNFTKCLELQNGKLTLNTDKLKDLEKQEYLNTISANKLSIAELQLAAVSFKGVGTERITEKISELEEQNALYETLIDEIQKVKPDKKKSSKSEKPQSVLDYEEWVSKQEHKIAMGQLKEDETYYNEKLRRAEIAYSGLTDYEDELWKAQEEHYKWQNEQEDKLFDKKIDNLDKLKDRALEGNDFDNARSQVKTAISTTQSRISELQSSGRVDTYDEIEELREQLESLNKELDEINDKEISFRTDKLDDVLNDLDEYAEKLDETFTTSDGTKLTTQEKWQTIVDVYKKAQVRIQEEIDRILGMGIEGHEEQVKQLEEKIEEYADKISDTFKSAVETEKSLLENQKSSLSDVYDKEIDKIKKQQEDSKDAADAEIDLIQEKIDNLKRVNDEKQSEYEIEKARQDLEKAGQRTRMTYGSDGTIIYTQDDEKIKEAQQNLDKLLLEKQVNALETQKSLLEDMRDKESDSYDKLIEDIESQKEQDERQFDILIQRLDEYLNPNSDTSNSDVWSAIAKMDGATYQNGKWVDKDGAEIDIAALIEKSAKVAEDNIENSKIDNTDTTSKKDVLNSIIDNAIDKRDSLKSDGKQQDAIIPNEQLEKILGLPIGGFKFIEDFAKNGGFNNINLIQDNIKRMADEIAYNNSVVNNNNNNAQNVTVTINGGITITNPVGDSNDLAKEILLNLDNEMDKLLYR